MGKCKACKYWNKETNYMLSENQGICDSDKLSEDNHELRDKNTDDMLIYPYDEGGCFVTGKDFGCVHHAEIVNE